MKNQIKKGIAKLGGSLLLGLALLGIAIFSTLVVADSDTITAPTIEIGNVAPTVDAIGVPPAQTPTEATCSSYEIFVNVTDQNGWSDITGANISVTTAVGDTTGSPRTNASCVAIGNVSAVTVNFSCTIQYCWADEAGAWTINVSGTDGTAVGYNDTPTYTVNALDAVNISQAPAWASALSAGTNDNEATSHLIVNATGNTDYTVVNITAYDFLNASDIIPISGLEVDDDNGFGSTVSMVNGTAVTVTGMALTSGYSGSEDTGYMRIDIPAGLPIKVYTSYDDWTVDTA